MAKRHFLQQAHKHTTKHLIAGQFASEKLDGQRAFWDGGVTHGLRAIDIPWANTLKDKKIRIATGLWSRYGKPIHAPEWWLNQLPPFPLDGELWRGRGQFQKTRSCVSKHIPIDAEWEGVKFIVWDSPTLESILYDSIIDIDNYKKDITGSLDFISNLGYETFHHKLLKYKEVFLWMQTNITSSLSILSIHKQERLSQYEPAAMQGYKHFLSEILHVKGEGLILRDPNALYLPERVHHMTKVKPYHDSEAIVIGYITGRKTNKGSKLLGMMGAMIVDWNGKIFELSGFTYMERELVCPSIFHDQDDFNNAQSWAVWNPETECPPEIEAVQFPRGTIVTFKYRELTDAGIPKEASYLRKVL